MADSTTIGKLVVQMLLDGQQYAKGADQVEAETKDLAGTLDQLVSQLRQQLAQAMEKAAAATLELAKSEAYQAMQAERAAERSQKAAEKIASAAVKAAEKVQKEAAATAATDEKAAADKVSAAQKAADGVAAIDTKAAAKAAKEAKSLADEKAKQAAKATKEAEKEAAKATATAEKAAKQKQKEADAIATGEAKAAKDAADARIHEQQRLGDMIYKLEQKSSSDVQKLEREKARALASISQENGAERARIEQLYDAQITSARQAETTKTEELAKEEADKVIAEQKRTQDALTVQIEHMGGQIRDRLAGVADTIGNVFQTGFQIAAAAVTTIAAAATYTGATFEQKMKQVGVIAQATGDEFSDLEDKARALGATTSFSASDAADAMHNLASAGLGVNDVLRATGDALMLAGAGSTDLATSSAALTSTMAQFNLSAAESGRIADVFARATAGSMFEVEDLAEAMKYGGVVGAGFGWSLEKTVATLTLFRNAGLQGSMAGTALRGALVAATTASKTNTDALAKYGLTMEDVNPQAHDFAEILNTIGKAGMSTADIIKVFGAESGAVVATLAQQAAQGSTQYQEMLTSLEGATGAASEMYKQMNATVVGSFAELSSAAEEFLLTLFDTYKGPLIDLLNAVTAVVNRTVTIMKGSSVEVANSMSTALGSVAKFINDNAQFIAESIAGFVRGVAAFAAQIQGVMPYLQALLPLLDDIALAMGVVWGSIKIAQFVSAVESAITALGAMGVSVETLMAIITTATGGTYALAAAIGALVAGIAILTVRYLDAESAANKLKAAQDRLAAGQIKADASRATQLEAVLAVQRAEAKAQLEAESASGKLTQARRAELEMLATLSGATAQQMEAAGQLALVNGRLRTVGSIAEEMDPATVAAFNAQVGALRQKADDSVRAVAALQQVLVMLEKDSEDVSAITIPGFGQVDTSGGVEDIKAKIARLQEMGEQYSNTAAKLDADYGKATSSMLEQEAHKQRTASTAAVAVAEEGAEGKTKAEKKYVDNVEALHLSLQRESQKQGQDAAEQLDVDMEARTDALRAAYTKQIEAAGNNAAEVTRLQAQQREDELALLGLWYGKKQEIVDAEAKKEADKKAATEQRALAMITALQREGMTEAQRLEAEKWDALASIAEASAEDRAQVEELYNAKIAAAQAKAAESTKKNSETMKQAWATVTTAIKAVVGAVQTVGQVLGDVGKAGSDFIGFWLGALEKLTGFSFSLADAMSAIVSAVQEAAKTNITSTSVSISGGAVAGDGSNRDPGGVVASAASDFVTGLVGGAVQFVGALADAIPYLLDALVAGIPKVVEALVAALPAIFAGVSAAIPALAQLFADQMPVMLDALVAGLPQVIQAVQNAIPVLIGSIVESIPTIIDAILASLPVLIQAMLEGAKTLIDTLLGELPRLLVGIIQMIPGIIQSLLAMIPSIITQLLAGVTDIVVALLAALPEIVTGVIDAIPGIIIALIEGVLDALPAIIMGVIRAIPKIIVGVVQGIPDIINAVLSELPQIILSLVAMVPDIIKGIVAALPQMIPALVGLIPDLIIGLITYMPQIIAAIFEALFIELPKQLPAIALSLGKALVQAVTSAWDSLVAAIGKLFSAAWEAITSIFSKKDKDKGSAYTGVSYVPATMRMTVHPGEMIVPANRNPVRAGDRADPALAGAGGTGGGGGGQPLQLDVLVDGRVVESVLMTAQKRGTATKLTRFVRSTAGVRAGLDIGKQGRR